MPIGLPLSLKEKVDELERTLLAISSICDVAENHYTDAPTPLSGCAYVTAHLMEHAMYQVEALRMKIDALPAEVKDAGMSY
jgi:hypothetical protein